MTAKPYAVNLWGSRPDLGNDDCWTGVDFETKAEAEAAYAKPETVAGFEQTLAHDAIWIEVAGPGIVKHRRLRPDHPPGGRLSSAHFDDWRHEQAMEAGMLHGVDAYNDAMGWGTGGSGDDDPS